MVAVNTRLPIEGYHYQPIKLRNLADDGDRRIPKGSKNYLAS